MKVEWEGADSAGDGSKMLVMMTLRAEVATQYTLYVSEQYTVVLTVKIYMISDVWLL